MSFAGWLIMNRWLTVPEARALHVLWHDGDDAGAIKRAVKAREYVVSEVRVGRNVLGWRRHSLQNLGAKSGGRQQSR